MKLFPQGHNAARGRRTCGKRNFTADYSDRFAGSGNIRAGDFYLKRWPTNSDRPRFVTRSEEFALRFYGITEEKQTFWQSLMGSRRCNVDWLYLVADGSIVTCATEWDVV